MKRKDYEAGRNKDGEMGGINSQEESWCFVRESFCLSTVAF